VTAKSDYQSRQLIRRTHRVGAQVFIPGCYSELNTGIHLGTYGIDLKPKVKLS
jgi:quinol-cytochrome oxidoreductase complex cytochrome b subunit